MRSATGDRAGRWRIVVALLLGFAASGTLMVPTAGAQQPEPTTADTARLLGYLWADGSYSNGTWDATGPSGGSDLIELLVERHGGIWIDRTELVFQLPAPYDWAEWKDGLPDDDARTRSAVEHPSFLAALLEGEGSTAGLVYDQNSCCTAGFTRGRLTGLLALLGEQGYRSATLETLGDLDSGEVKLDASDFADLRSTLEFVCPAQSSAIRVPGAQDFDRFGSIRWFGPTSSYAKVVRTDCLAGRSILPVGPPVGDCVITSDGNGALRVSWSFLRGTVAVRRNGAFLTTVSALEYRLVDVPATGSSSYTLRVTSDGLRTDAPCGQASTDDPAQVPPTPGATCMGRTITHLGTGENDILDGTSEVDVISGFGGDDLIRGFGKGDFICAGMGNDRVRAGYGDDRVFGGDGNDRIIAGAGADRIRGGNGADWIEGNRGPDILDGQNGADVLRGGRGFDSLHGGPGSDVLRGGPHRDVCAGGWGSDRVALDCETVRP